MKNRLFLLVALVAAGNCVAAASPTNMTYEQYNAQKTEFVKNMDDGKTYSEIAPDQRKHVTELLNRMGERLQSAGATDQLSDSARMAFFNDQEEVNTVLTKAAADSRLVCKRETPVGSHMPVKSCKTVAQRNAERAGADRLIDRAGPAGLEGRH